MRQFRVRLTMYLALAACFLTAAGVFTARTVQAASAAVTFSADSESVEKGDKVSVLITVESSAIVGDFEAFISYDSKVLEFETGGSLVSGGDGILRIQDRNSQEQNEMKKYSLSFKAKKVGVSEIAVSDQASVYDPDGNEMSVSSNRIAIEVISSKTLSRDTSLKTLTISPGTLTPDFDPDIKEYEVQVEKETKKLFVSAVPALDEASVLVEGNKELEDTETLVSVKVTAEAGNTDLYKIIVKKNGNTDTNPAEKPEKDSNNKEDTKNKDSSVVREEDTLYLNIDNQYKILEAPSDQIPADYMEADVLLDKEKITAYLPADEPNGRFYLLYAENGSGEQNFYQYDTEEETLQYFEVDQAVDYGNKGLRSAEEEYNRKVSQLSILIGILCAVCVLLLIAVIRQFLKRKGYQDDDLV